MTPAEIETRLKAIGRYADAEIPVVESLILLGALERGISDLSPYQAHIAELHAALSHRIAAHPYTPEEEINDWRLSCLAHVLFDTFSYHGDPAHAGFTEAEKINFLDVITSRSGIPVALGALFYDLAHGQHWPIAGLNFPGHFIMRLEEGASRLIFDPFHKAKKLDAAAMRALLKEMVGQQAELSHEYYAPVSPRSIILRFCNNRKIRFLQQGDYEAAMRTVQQELWVAPQEPLLYFDGGVLAIKLDLYGQALDYLNTFIDLSDDGQTIAEAKAMILSLQRNLQ